MASALAEMQQETDFRARILRMSVSVSLHSGGEILSAV
jgi:hypothetical protein